MIFKLIAGRLILWALTALIAVNTQKAGAALLIKGDLRINVAGDEKFIPFELTVGKYWKIYTILQSDNTVVYISGLETNYCYHIKRVIRGDTAKEFGWTSDAIYPWQHYGSGQILWLAYCSKDFLDKCSQNSDLGTNEFPLLDFFSKNESFYNNEILTRIARINGQGSLPNTVEFFGKSYVPTMDGGKSGSGEKFLAGRYTVEELTNAFGFKIPKVFTFTRFLPTGTKMSRTGSNVAEEYEAKLTSVVPVDEPNSYLPKIETSRIRIVDSRVSKKFRIGDLNYVVTNKIWPEIGDSKLSSKIADAKDQAIIPVDPNLSAKKAIIIVLFLTVTVAFAFLVWFSRKSDR